MQLRYHWEIAPLSDVFLVYTRDAELPTGRAAGESFAALFTETLDDTIGEHFAVKFRYRFGS